MGRRKDFLDEYASDSSEGSEASADDHRNKRARFSRNKESAALGVFADESDDDQKQGWKGKNLRRKTTSFVAAGQKTAADSDDEDEDDELDVYDAPRTMGGLGFSAGKADEEDPEEEETPRMGLGGASRPAFAQQAFTKPSGATTPADESPRPSFGLGARKFQSFAPASTDSGASTPTEPHPGLGSGLGFTPALGRGFVSSASLAAQGMPTMSATPPPNGETPVVRPSAFGTPVEPRGKKGRDPSSTPQPNPESFAARLMAKMGYKQGQGLGKQGQGRLEPVMTKVRPQGVGVGAVKEMSEQEKKESRRAAKLRGEELSDSESEKERKRKARKKAAGKASGASTPGGSTPLRPKKEKLKFRTTAEIEAAADGLKVPNVLKNIIDMTGGTPKKIESGAAGIMKEEQPKKMDEQMKLARMARRDLELFAGEWKTLQDRKIYIEAETERLNAGISEQAAEIKRLQEMVELSKEIQKLSVTRDLDNIETLVSQLEQLQTTFSDEITPHHLSELAIAALYPLFKTELSTWSPLEHPTFWLHHLLRLRPLLGLRSRDELEASFKLHGTLNRPKFATPFESMLTTLWLPRVRSALNNTWNPLDPTPALKLLESWRHLLPPWIESNLITHTIYPKLKSTLETWKPRPNKHSPPPHHFLFPLLPLLPSNLLASLLPPLKSALKLLLTHHPLSQSPASLALDSYSHLLTPAALETLTLRHLLPRLSTHLSSSLTINPASQSLDALDALLLYTPSPFRPSTIATLLEATWAPKWLATLHQWLISPNASLSEIQQWYLFWKSDVFPPEITATKSISATFTRGLDLINTALDLGPEQIHTLPPPRETLITGPSAAVHKERRGDEERRKKRREEEERREKREKEARKQAMEPVSLKEALEDWCAERDLLLVPLRKAREGTGEPLWRVSESASGGGGVVVCFRGEVVWVRDKKGGEESWKVVGLEELEKMVLGE